MSNLPAFQHTRKGVVVFTTPFRSLVAILALLLFDFVATEILFGLGEDDVLPKNWIILPKAQLIGSIHGVLLGVVSTNAGLLRNQADELAFSVILLCHNS